MLGKRLKQVRKEKGLTQIKAAELLGIPSRTYVAYERSEREANSEMLIKLADFYDVTIDYLLGKVDVKNATGRYPQNTTPYNPDKMVPFPVIGRVAAGITCLAETNIETYMLADATNLNRDYDYVWLRVTGDSMEPFILDGDYVLVQMQSIVNSGDVAVVIVNGDDGLVKKILIENDCITLISKNPYYPPRKFIKKEMNEIRIFGKVIESKRIF